MLTITPRAKKKKKKKKKKPEQQQARQQKRKDGYKTKRKTTADQETARERTTKATEVTTMKLTTETPNLRVTQEQGINLTIMSGAFLFSVASSHCACELLPSLPLSASSVVQLVPGSGMAGVSDVVRRRHCRTNAGAKRYVIYDVVCT